MRKSEQIALYPYSIIKKSQNPDFKIDEDIFYEIKMTQYFLTIRMKKIILLIGVILILLLSNVNAYGEITPHQFSKKSCAVRMFDMTGVDSMFDPSLTHPYLLNQTPLFSRQTKILIGGWKNEYEIIEGYIVMYNLGNYQSFYIDGTRMIAYDIDTPQELMNIFYLISFPKINI